MEGLQARAEIHARCTELRAIDLRSSHQFEEEIGAASSENLVLIHKTEFSIRTGNVLIERKLCNILPASKSNSDSKGCSRFSA